MSKENMDKGSSEDKGVRRKPRAKEERRKRTGSQEEDVDNDSDVGKNEQGEVNGETEQTTDTQQRGHKARRRAATVRKESATPSRSEPGSSDNASFDNSNSGTSEDSDRVVHAIRSSSRTKLSMRKSDHEVDQHLRKKAREPRRGSGDRGPHDVSKSSLKAQEESAEDFVQESSGRSSSCTDDDKAITDDESDGVRADGSSQEDVKKISSMNQKGSRNTKGKTPEGKDEDYTSSVSEGTSKDAACRRRVTYAWSLLEVLNGILMHPPHASLASLGGSPQESFPDSREYAVDVLSLIGDHGGFIHLFVGAFFDVILDLVENDPSNYLLSNLEKILVSLLSTRTGIAFISSLSVGLGLD